VFPSLRYYHDILEEWKELEQDMFLKQQHLLDKEPIISDEHYDLIFDDA
jgi:hypothetical protein